MLVGEAGFKQFNRVIGEKLEGIADMFDKWLGGTWISGIAWVKSQQERRFSSEPAAKTSEAVATVHKEQSDGKHRGGNAANNRGNRKHACVSWCGWSSGRIVFLFSCDA